VLELERDILLCHGSPDDDLRYLMEEVMENGVVLASAEKIAERLGDVSGKLVLCGHSHIPRVVSLSRGVQIVNPGSVGLQAYDWSATFRDAREGNRLDSAHALETGYALKAPA
jgi:predicted phosphodiesterase